MLEDIIMSEVSLFRKEMGCGLERQWRRFLGYIQIQS